MSEFRTVKKIATGMHTQDGAGVKLKRILSRDNTKDFDPFLMLDFFNSTNPDDYTKGFPWHPHRGIETITYLLEGQIEHKDSLENVGMIRSGDCQWMTAGSGIMHQEMPLKSPKMLGFQLWLNMPRKSKMTKPAYHDILKDSIPIVKEDGADIRVISGEYKNTKGFEPSLVKATLLDIHLQPNAEFTLEIGETDAVFLFSLQGDFKLGNTDIPQQEAVLTTDGSKLKIVGKEHEARILIARAQPLSEPIAWAGPIVMNTEGELRLAFQELEYGTFIKDEIIM